jgi:hypothetical protein
MNELANQVFNLLKQTNIDVDISEDEYSKLFEYFRKNELNQFNVFIIQRVLTKKDFTLPPDEVIPYLTASLADKVDYSKFPTETNTDLMVLISTIYKVVFLLDVKEIYNKRF